MSNMCLDPYGRMSSLQGSVAQKISSPAVAIPGLVAITLTVEGIVIG